MTDPSPPVDAADPHLRGSLPPGQHLVDRPPVMHYGRVPDRDPSAWTVTIGGATASGAEQVFALRDVLALPPAASVGDMHCATRWTARDVHWAGVRACDLLDLAPPAPEVETALVFAEFGYSANVPVAELQDARALLATHLDGEALTAERGAPLRLVIPHLYTWKGPKWLRGWNYLMPEDPTQGFWELRGYHHHGVAWEQERFTHQG